MGVPYYGDFAEDDTVDIPFNTFTSDDPSASSTITNFINTDVHIHKDGGTTQRNNAAGITVSVDFDGITGNHLVQIDTSDNTVADFWVTGSEYQVRIEGTTVDGATINAWIGAFSIERAGGVIALLKLIQAAVITNAAGADIAADIIAVKAETANIVADTNELQTDDYPTSIAAIQTTVDAIETAVITNAAGVDVAADIIAVKAETANILTDTGTTLPGTLSTIDGKIDTVDGIVDSILTDTGTTLDAIVDAILVDTGTTLPATLSSIDGKIDTIDTVVDAIKVITDALTAAAATKIALSAGSMVTGTVSHDNTAASTTVFYSDDVTEATADHYNGRLVTFTSGDLQGQYTDITDYALDSGEGKFTVTALTEAPADNVTFIII